MSESEIPVKGSWLLSDSRRSWTAMGIATVATFIATTMVLIWSEETDDRVQWASTLWAWSGFAVIHSLLTWLAFRKRSGEEFARALDIDRRRRRRGLKRFRVVRWLASGDSAPSWSVQVSFMALVGTGALLVIPSLRTPTLMASGGVLVAASWVNVWVAFAMQYAHADHTDGGLSFPGAEPRSFSDYLYVALAGQTTFGTTDVEIVTTKMRRLSMNHSLIAFVFNSVILAMIVSLILGGAAK